MSLISLLICFMSAISCTSVTKNENNNVVWKIKKFSKKIQKEKNIILTMYGLDCHGANRAHDGKVHVIDIGYRVDKKLKLDDARALFFSIVNELLVELNQDSTLRSCFYNYPLSYKDLYFRLSFDYENKGYLSRDEVSMIAILENEIMYFLVEEDGNSLSMETKTISRGGRIQTGIAPKTRCTVQKLSELGES